MHNNINELDERKCGRKKREETPTIDEHCSDDIGGKVSII
jgi:hypothetical protein